MNTPTTAYNRDATLLLWQETAKRAAQLKDEEMALRKLIVENEFQTENKGTKRVPLGNGYQLKAVIKKNLTVTKNEAVDPADYSHLPQLMSTLPPHVQASLLRWKPEVVTKVYDGLTEAERAIVNNFVLLKDGAPELVIEEPKQKAG